MSLDFIFVATSRPIEQLESISELNEEFFYEEQQLEEFLKKFFPEFIIEGGIGKSRDEQICFEFHFSPSSIHVGLKGDGNIFSVLDRACTIAADCGFALVDVQLSELYFKDRASNQKYLDWYDDVRIQYEQYT